MIQAWQHIYSNVEATQSPSGRGGFQTLFYTKNGLNEAEISEMEGRLLYFPGQVEPIKRLYFHLNSGKGVISQITPLTEPDQYGRKGRYLAHSLVLSLEALAQIEGDPFAIFRHFTFITTVEAALAQGDRQTGDIHPARITPMTKGGSALSTAQVWPDFKALALLALQAEQLTKNREPITFTGPAEAIEATLEAAFLVLPQAIRQHCSFDTYFYRCNLVATYFWGIGLPEPPVRAKSALVNCQSKQISDAVQRQPETAYEGWVWHCLNAGQLEAITHQCETAFALATWLSGGQTQAGDLDQADSNLIETFFKLNPARVEALLKAHLGQIIPEVFVERTAARIIRDSSSLTLYQDLRQGFNLNILIEVIFQIYAENGFRQPNKNELKALADLLKKTEAGEMREMSLFKVFLAYWTTPAKEFPAVLAKLDPTLYRQFLSQILESDQVKDPLSLLAPGHGAAYLEIYLAAKGLDKIPDLVEACLKELAPEENVCLTTLIPNLPKLSRRDLVKLTRLVEDWPEAPDAFRAEIEAALAQKPGGGVKGLFRRIWPGGSESS